MDDHQTDAVRVGTQLTQGAADGALIELHTDAAAGICRIVVCGESDATSKARLRSLLTGIDLVQTPHVQLSLSGLAFCDVGTAAALVDLAYDVRAAGGTVSVADPPGLSVRMMLKILDAGDDLALPDPPHDPYWPRHRDQADMPPL